MWLPSLVLSTFLAFTACASSNSDAGSSAVVTLTTGNFASFIKENPVSLVKFYAPWCGHCKKLAPAYEAAAAELKEKNGPPLAEVDATIESDLAKEYGVQGFPTLFLFRNGKAEPYNGGRTQAAIVEWVTRMTGPAVTQVKSREEAQKKAEEAAVYFYAVVKSKDSSEYKAYDAVASAERLKGTFFVEIDSTLSEPSKVTVYRKNEESATVKVASKEQLSAWVSNEAIPYFGQVNGENYATYAARSNNWFWFGGDVEEYEKHGPTIRKVSKNYRTDFNFVWLDTDTLKGHAENALGMKEFPGVTVVWEESKYKFDGQWTEKALTKFIEAVKAGKAKKFLKTEPIPESNDEAVKVVVGQQFSEMVLQKDKDVFLKIYAPWCGHCKKIAPAWEELAERTKNSKHFMVAKFDGTANEPDVPGFDFHGFPTLYFIKAGTKTPIAYDGERTVEAFLDFAKKNAAYSLTVQESSEESKEEL
eukprot:Gregarina_sp_Pseudo_9__5548@NODE_737_length_2294_cov_84_345898_g693_i0_p1_GENE_NODE_737_length_2294_cov_84_345898_g693_i0NODE_737_length_2294_cov_84_345898_g693_i0_p1_ORF_typecomplete_len475_score144_99Thioredoxin/PF00085_20/2_4e29Thioredoxin/PF00085_20/1_6e03Thioredoxin/PF00085_20/0_0062Thioredoxin/PF00085_20/1_4e23Thioredoxin_6/PF13848_6/28Thioredoxin_6/PF13848_6/1_3e07Thioredoxin_6/PF13848_6/1_8e21Thioredoxin_6/PF13848_6/4_9e02Thioredoxin_6/PF13848_6/0_031Calsequestrin/PF01216_17/8_8e18Calseq